MVISEVCIDNYEFKRTLSKWTWLGVALKIRSQGHECGKFDYTGSSKLWQESE